MKKSDFLKKLRRTILISMPGDVLTEEKMEMIDIMADNILETMDANGFKPPTWTESNDMQFGGQSGPLLNTYTQRRGWEPE